MIRQNGHTEKKCPIICENRDIGDSNEISGNIGVNALNNE
jgi:hypothetical protein